MQESPRQRTGVKPSARTLHGGRRNVQYFSWCFGTTYKSGHPDRSPKKTEPTAAQGVGDVYRGGRAAKPDGRVRGGDSEPHRKRNLGIRRASFICYLLTQRVGCGRPRNHVYALTSPWSETGGYPGGEGQPNKLPGRGAGGELGGGGGG